MKNLSSKEEVVDMLKNLLAVEIGARDRYIEETEEFTHRGLKVMLDSIRKDEDRHVEMLEGLIGRLEGKGS